MFLLVDDYHHQLIHEPTTYVIISQLGTSTMTDQFGWPSVASNAWFGSGDSQPAEPVLSWGEIRARFWAYLMAHEPTSSKIRHRGAVVTSHRPSRVCFVPSGHQRQRPPLPTTRAHRRAVAQLLH